MHATQRLTGKLSDLAGGLQVRRVLPDARRRAVGPFVFFDHIGPVTLPPEVDSDVGPHPHIGLATVTYLFEGGFLHRDSLGTVQTIAPGAINWMTAGRGVVHSERVPDDQRGQARRLHGLQLWVALPPAQETAEPSFQHVAASALPTVALPGGGQVRVLVGEAFGVRSPVRSASPTLYLDVRLPADADWTLPALAAEMAIYAPEHGLVVDGEALPAREMAVLADGRGARLRAGPTGAHVVVVGGAALEQPVRMWWNFVSTDRERIADAARRWQDGGFDAIPGETSRVAAPPWKG
ncbi:pirin family protein [Ideonella sp. A 288]|uniref:pirin family protein n=1 Tax=Ideonella sp. A 288 TaxID=1962181 RepID=UPI000B4A5EC5|nr:pirin family protein [Ideonella sp. A 288]